MKEKASRALSSVGSERLPYKQRVGGSNPSAPTRKDIEVLILLRALSSVGSERLPYKQRVGGSNPSAPTLRSTLVAIWAFSSAGSEHLSDRQGVGGSNPSTPTHRGDSDLPGCDGRLAQLVQSVCLTSRGSGVRIPQRPPNQDEVLLCDEDVPPARLFLFEPIPSVSHHVRPHVYLIFALMRLRLTGVTPRYDARHSSGTRLSSCGWSCSSCL